MIKITNLFLLSCVIPAVALANEGINLENKIGMGATQDSLNINKKNYKEWLKQQLNAPKTDPTINDRHKLPETNQEIYDIYIKNDNFLNKGQINQENLWGPNSLYNKVLNKRVDYAINSEWRLREFMLNFWANHFHIGGKVSTSAVIFLDNYENMLREKSLSNFKDLIYSVSTHPNMLYYLDNVQNYVSEDNNEYYLNENYAREFLELHTMGVESGYTQDDIKNLAKILSGHSNWVVYAAEKKNINKDNISSNFIELENETTQELIDSNENYSIKGFYYFWNARHLKGDKVILSKTIKEDGETELKKAIDIIVDDPRTAHYISSKIAKYIIGDEVSKTTVDKMAKVFKDTNGDIKKVLVALFETKEFDNSLSKKTKFKDTYTYTISSIRSPFYKNVRQASKTIETVSNFLIRTNTEPYSIDTPQGFYFDNYYWKNPTKIQEHMYFAKIISGNESNIDFSFISKVANKKIKNKKELEEFLTTKEWLER